MNQRKVKVGYTVITISDWQKVKGVWKSFIFHDTQFSKSGLPLFTVYEAGTGTSFALLGGLAFDSILKNLKVGAKFSLRFNGVVNGCDIFDAII